MSDEQFELRLYVAGRTPKAIRAFANLKKICEEYLPGKYEIEVIDLLEQPQLAAGDEILAIPTLVRKLPEPLRKIVGDLRNTERTWIRVPAESRMSASPGTRVPPPVARSTTSCWLAETWPSCLICQKSIDQVKPLSAPLGDQTRPRLIDLESSAFRFGLPAMVMDCSASSVPVTGS